MQTHDTKEIIRARAERDPQYRRGLLCNALTSMLGGDVATMKAALRNYIHATLGVKALAERTHIPSKSLIRMLSPNENPTLRNLVTILTALQKNERIHFERIRR